MAGYIGVKCPVCSKRFTTSDDIVVCPVCGAPHHRHCYKENGDCIFAEEHLSGKEWHAPQEAEAEAAAGAAQTRQCASCGASNPAESVFCQVCGNRMAAPSTQEQQGTPWSAVNANRNHGPREYTGSWDFPNYGATFDTETLRYGGISADGEIAGEKVRDVATYVNVNTAYFLPRFKRFQDGASAFSVNLSAFIFSYFYFFYRKMYALGFLLLSVSVIGFIPYLLQVRELLPEILQDPGMAQTLQLLQELGANVTLDTSTINYSAVNFYHRLNLMMILLKLVIRFLASCFVNHVYYRRAIRDVRVIREKIGETMEPARYGMTLAYRGGISNLAIVTGLLLTFVVNMSVYVFLFRGIY